ncbi:MAG: biotin/lipoyl-binding protein [Phycisphaerales bacterium]|nr:biotin/lipoyl-binding protein [Phycisphaerales bacterium]
MVIKYLLPVLAAAGVGLAVYTVATENKPRPVVPPVVEPAAAPFATYVAGAGLIEASTENISVGSPVGGIVREVRVKAGQRVNAGDPLFTIDDRTVRAELAYRKAALEVANSELARLRAQPRPEDLPPLQARVDAARSILDDLEAQLAMWERADRRAVADEELSKRRFAVVEARANLSEAQAAFDRLKVGAWSQDVRIAQAQVEQAQAQVDAAQVEVDRHTIAAPVPGEILKVNIRTGEYVATGGAGGGGGGGGGAMSETRADGLVVMGGTDTLHVRVDVDENDAWRVREGRAGKAFIRGNPALHADLAFVRFEPYVIPKKSLTGASTERVDTRVLQVIYRFARADLPVFVGQQMDVFIDAGEGAGGDDAGRPSSAPTASPRPAPRAN